MTSHDFDFLELGQAIQNAREKQRITREELAEELGISARHLQSIEKEGQYPSFPLFIQLVTMFHISVLYLIIPDWHFPVCVKQAVNFLRFRIGGSTVQRVRHALHAYLAACRLKANAAQIFFREKVETISRLHCPHLVSSRLCCACGCCLWFWLRFGSSTFAMREDISPAASRTLDSSPRTSCGSMPSKNSGAWVKSNPCVSTPYFLQSR